jgi:hypothetical protein
MDVARAVLANEPGVARRDVADVRREPVARVERVHPKHRPVADDLRDDRGRRDRRTALVSVDDRDVLRRRRPETKSVDQASLSGGRQRMQGAPKPVQVRPMEPDAVDLAGRDDLNRDSGCAVQDSPEQLLAVLR